MSAPPPSGAKATYFSMLVNSDPRVAFDVLHLGALRAISEMEEDIPLWQEEHHPTFAKNAIVVGAGADARFVIPTHQPALDVRLQQPQDLAGVTAYLEADAQDVMQEVLGPAVLHAVQKHRPQVMQERQTRAGPFADTATTKTAPGPQQ